MLTPRYTSAFKKDFKLAQKRGQDLGKLRQAIELLASGEPLPESYDDHPLRGNYAGMRDCHIEPDWILIHAIQDDELILRRTGTHSDLFRK
ncbi:MAG: type II toxin-antitoxin system YafQ family toxin [Chloroflexi bacterium]|nr:type II toxin-antitoxin system YafQ family toxin [Chloroflexota bacterium]